MEKRHWELCRNKLVVVTSEWFPWLCTSWRDSGCEALVQEQTVTRKAAAQFMLQPQCTDNPQNIVCEGVITNAPYFKVAIGNRCSDGCQCVVHVVVRLGSCLLGCFMQLVSNNKTNLS